VAAPVAAPVEAPVVVPVAQKAEDGRLKPEAGGLLKNSTTDMTPVGEAAAPPEIPRKTDDVKSGGTPASASELPQPSKKLKLVETSENSIQKAEEGRLKEEAPRLPGAGSEVYGLKSKVSLFSVSMSPLAILNRVMTVLVIGLIAVVFYSIMSIRPGIAQDLSRQIEGAGSLAVAPQTIVAEEIPALDIYLEKVGSRSLFASKMIPKQGDPVAIEKAGAPKDFSLVAVSMDSASPADSMAIIKNKSDSKTYFVKLGQTVGSTDYVLDRVLADRIVLKQKKMEFELK
jgi:hypothetical protein